MDGRRVRAPSLADEVSSEVGKIEQPNFIVAVRIKLRSIPDIAQVLVASLQADRRRHLHPQIAQTLSDQGAEPSRFR